MLQSTAETWAASLADGALAGYLRRLAEADGHLWTYVERNALLDEAAKRLLGKAKP